MRPNPAFSCHIPLCLSHSSPLPELLRVANIRTRQWELGYKHILEDRSLVSDCVFPVLLNLKWLFLGLERESSVVESTCWSCTGPGFSPQPSGWTPHKFF